MKRLCFLGFFLLILVGLLSHAFAASSKIAVASEGKTVEATVSAVAGRSQYFLIFDSRGKLMEVLENPYRDLRGGAGIKVVDLLAQRGVKVVVAGTFGDRMIEQLKARNIKYLEFKGKVEEAVKKALAQ